MISPNTPIKKKKGIVYNWKSKGIAAARYQSEEMAATDPKKSIRATGIEKSKMNHEYQGRNPAITDPPANIK